MATTAIASPITLATGHINMASCNHQQQVVVEGPTVPVSPGPSSSSSPVVVPADVCCPRGSGTAPQSNIPSIKESDITKGSVLGKGTFGMVYEVSLVAASASSRLCLRSTSCSPVRLAEKTNTAKTVDVPEQDSRASARRRFRFRGSTSSSKKGGGKKQQQQQQQQERQQQQQEQQKCRPSTDVIIVTANGGTGDGAAAGTNAGADDHASCVTSDTEDFHIDITGSNCSCRHGSDMSSPGACDGSSRRGFCCGGGSGSFHGSPEGDQKPRLREVGIKSCDSESTALTAIENGPGSSSNLDLADENPAEEEECDAETCSECYALKCIKPGLSSKTARKACSSLKREARFLSRYSEHPNIVSLRATVGEAGSYGFQLLLERLPMTLEAKITDWLEEQKTCHQLLKQRRRRQILSLPYNFGGLFSHQPKHRGHRKRQQDGKQQGKDDEVEVMGNRLLEERTAAIREVAEAMKFLHSKRVLFRDLKPTNIGLDRNGKVKIFDFGIAKELDNAKLVHPPDGFKLTGLSGSRRYMAPEVARSLPYGFSADVYSFGILCWHVMMMHKPFLGYSASDHMERVVLRGERPMPPSQSSAWYCGVTLSSKMQSLVESCWSPEPRKRPSFDTICEEV